MAPALHLFISLSTSLLVLLACGSWLVAAAPGLHFRYPSFVKGRLPALQGAATPSPDDAAAIFLTPNSSSSSSGSRNNRVGRLVFKEPLVLGSPGWSASSARLQTYFTFRLFTQPAPYGAAADGLAFFLSASSPTIPSGSTGEYLGIQDPSSTATNRFFAVEFDTFKNTYDPSASHVGIDINSVKSIAKVDTSDSKSPYYLYKDYVFRAWIRYDASKEHEISVWLDNCSKSKTACSEDPTSDRPLLVASYDLSAIFGAREPIYVGISASTGDFIQGAAVYSWSFDAHA